MGTLTQPDKDCIIAAVASPFLDSMSGHVLATFPNICNIGKVGESKCTKDWYGRQCWSADITVSGRSARLGSLQLARLVTRIPKGQQDRQATWLIKIAIAVSSITTQYSCARRGLSCKVGSRLKAFDQLL